MRPIRRHSRGSRSPSLNPGGQAPVVQRVRIRYAKRGPLRSPAPGLRPGLRARAARAGVPIAFSQGFTPHPKISYASAPRRVWRGEAEYLEIGLREPSTRRSCAKPSTVPSRPDSTYSTRWRPPAAVWPTGSRRRTAHRVARRSIEGARAGGGGLHRRRQDQVERMTKQGRRTFDARAAVVSIDVMAPAETPSGAAAVPCAILELVVRQVTRPFGPMTSCPASARWPPGAAGHPKVIRLAQGTLTAQGEIVDPLEAGSRRTTIGER
ncbi:DUF2344 domain-containing protein [Micromonospora sp. BRA006-A]|nr:DUF2344 domain-containing protein [Micromonospora sp. BRA006-A]